MGSRLLGGFGRVPEAAGLRYFCCPWWWAQIGQASFQDMLRLINQATARLRG